eukprot:scaffold3276_cov168-Amphora_coffeaeformis.AAC.2
MPRHRVADTKPKPMYTPSTNAKNKRWTQEGQQLGQFLVADMIAATTPIAASNARAAQPVG